MGEERERGRKAEMEGERGEEQEINPSQWNDKLISDVIQEAR